jgi:hypothetical protein
MSVTRAAQRANRERLWAFAGVLVGGLACASSAPPPVHTVQKAAPPAAHLAWLPAESVAGKKLADAINAGLGQVSLPGAAAGVKAAVSMEVAQLAIECTDPTPTCYTAVGRSIGADEMLWVELGAGGRSSSEVRVALLLYDVRAGTPPRRVERTFAGVDAAGAGVAALADTLKAGPQ